MILVMFCGKAENRVAQKQSVCLSVCMSHAAATLRDTEMQRGKKARKSEEIINQGRE